MRVLITRPAAEIDAAASGLAAAGHEVAAHPLLVIERLVDAKLNLTAAQAFVVVEPEGARALANLIGVRSFPVFADGPATADAALAVGFRDVVVGSGAPELAKLIQQRCSPERGALVYASGVGAPVNLAAILNTMGFSVRQTPVFTVQRAEVLPPDVVNDLKNGRIDAIAFYTPDEARAFVTLAGRAGVESTCRTLTAVVASPIVAAPLTTIKFANTVTASTPDPAAMVAAVTAAATGRREKEAVREKAAAEKADAERREREALERATREKADAAAREQALAAERAAQQKAEEERLAAARANAERERMEKEAAEAREREKQRAEAAAREAAHKEAEAHRIAREKAEALERAAAEAERQEREAAEAKAEAARIARAAQEKAEAEARAQEKARQDAESREKERAEAARAAQAAREKAEAAAREKEQARAAAQQRIEEERLAQAKAKAELERVEKEAAQARAREAAEARAQEQAREAAATATASAPPAGDDPPGSDIIDRTTETESQEKVLGWLFKRRRNESDGAAPVDDVPLEPVAAPVAEVLEPPTPPPPPPPDPEPVAESPPPATMPAPSAVQMDSVPTPEPAPDTQQPEVTAMPPPDDQPTPMDTPPPSRRGMRPAEDERVVETPVAKKSPSFLRRVALYLLVIVILAAALVAGAPWWVPPVRQALQVILPETASPAPTAATAADPRIDSQAASIAALANRVTALEQRPAATGADVSGLEQRLTALEQAVPAAPAETADTSSAEALTGQAQLLTSLTARVATLEAAIGNVSRLDDLARQVQTLEKGSADAAGVLALSERVTTLEQTERNQAANRTAAAALVLASAQLRDAIATGRSFTVELETVKTMAARSDVALESAGFESFAASGLPSVESLRARFAGTASAIVRAGVIPDQSATWLRRTMDRALSVATFRPTGEPTGTAPSAIVARAEARIAEGNLAAAVQELSALEGAALAAAEPWLTEARARVAADQALTALSTKAIAGLSAAVTP